METIAVTQDCFIYPCQLCEEVFSSEEKLNNHAQSMWSMTALCVNKYLVVWKTSTTMNRFITLVQRKADMQGGNLFDNHPFEVLTMDNSAIENIAESTPAISPDSGSNEEMSISFKNGFL